MPAKYRKGVEIQHNPDGSFRLTHFKKQGSAIELCYADDLAACPTNKKALPAERASLLNLSRPHTHLSKVRPDAECRENRSLGATHPHNMQQTPLPTTSP